MESVKKYEENCVFINFSRFPKLLLKFVGKMFEMESKMTDRYQFSVNQN